MRTVESIGQTPTFWNRDVIFVANLMGLFFGNEEETRMLAETVGELDSYGGRLLPMLELVYRGGSRNHLVLEREPDPDLVRYFGEVGLSLPGHSVLSHSDYLELGNETEQGSSLVEQLEGLEPRRLDGYVTD
ncbi:MAG: hypothetical protein AAGC68_06140, partial [Verrucomicrobiota bacterium]